MLTVFTILMWISAVITAPGKPGNWTELCLSWALTAAAGVAAAHVPARSRDAA